MLNKEYDYICITGDAFVDHPSFGIAIIKRLLEDLGYSVAVISMPEKAEDITRYGAPRYAFMVTAGNIDSMVSNYTVAKKRRKTDSYVTEGYNRPDRATECFCGYIREKYGDIPIVIGGIEASLRRFSHYDYWADKVLPSILVSSRADILVYGMGERAVTEISTRLLNGETIKSLTDIKGTCVLTEQKPKNAIELPTFDDVVSSKIEFAKSFKLQYKNQDHINAMPLVERYAEKYLLQNMPAAPLEQRELDKIYALPFSRTSPYENIPSLFEVEFSIIQSRGCFGGCNFCSLAFHQGRYVTARSKQSILDEAKGFVGNKNFKGYISDVGGPTANFRTNSCEKQKKEGLCKEKKCLAPTVCKNLVVDHSEYLDILKSLREIDGIKKVFIRSGVRFDYIMQDNDEFLYELCKNHISGQLKVAPEHCSDTVLNAMGKPTFNVYKDFSEKFARINKKLGKKQYLVPYLMSSHPGSRISDAVKLAEYLKEHNLKPEQVQDFYPTPATISTCMYYTGKNPLTMEDVYIQDQREKAMQRALLQYDKAQNKELVVEALKRAKREDLIGFSEKCLVASGKNKKTVTYKVGKKTKSIRIKKKK